MKLAGWGRYPVVEAQIFAPSTVEELAARVQAGGAIARGNGRAYGDTAISRENTIDMRHFNRMIAFDAEKGVLETETGVLLGDVIDTFLPRGWFLFVTPGTKLITLGGAIAADVHGKNHHKDGSFRACVKWIDLMDGSGAVRRCSRRENAELFDYTLGGMGLTGVILRTAVHLRPVESAWIKQRLIPAPNLATAIDLFEQHQDVTYSVAWVDCVSGGRHLGRSLVMLGEHARLTDLTPRQRKAPFDAGQKMKLAVPFDAPSCVLNRLSIRAFNTVYYWNGARKTGDRLIDWDSYFYPLDSIIDWNRIYGGRGFAQFQCALPLETSADGLSKLLTATSEAGAGSFLAVLKRFGKGEGAYSFPMEGYTLALDFPINRRTLRLMSELDDIVINRGGRFYLAKDSRMTRDTLRHSDARAQAFSQWREQNGLKASFASAQSERLGL
jgi:decaprenylphospho-beta-D-ribofuranose 2-oxidase